MLDVLGGISGLSHWYIRFPFLVGEPANQEVQLSHVIRLQFLSSTVSNILTHLAGDGDSCTAEECGTTDAIAGPNPKLYPRAFKPRSAASDWM